MRARVVRPRLVIVTVLDRRSVGGISRRWQERIDTLGYSRGDILDEPYGSGLAVFDPDGIAIELFAPRSSGST
jgi:hypothetical protein